MITCVSSRRIGSTVRLRRLRRRAAPTAPTGRMCPVMSQFSSTQRNDIAKAIAPRVRNENGRIEAGGSKRPGVNGSIGCNGVFYALRCFTMLCLSHFCMLHGLLLGQMFGVIWQIIRAWYFSEQYYR